ncbi:MAG TPA: DUF4190 domain-containing protein, partial [Pilimelia sp.]|nr:DUF4190 domain-containing protein [Pilimelia sp.]
SAPQDAWSGQSAAWSAEPAAWSAQPAPPAVGGPAASGQPGAWTGQPGPAPAGYPGYPYLVVARPTNGLAIASLVVSIVAALGLCAYGVGGVLGIPAAIMGHVARRQVRERGEQGDGFALAAVVVGWIATAIAVLAIIAWIIFIVVIANSDDATVTAD